jgi:hypothetical protein
MQHGNARPLAVIYMTFKSYSRSQRSQSRTKLSWSQTLEAIIALTAIDQRSGGSDQCVNDVITHR